MCAFVCSALDIVYQIVRMEMCLCWVIVPEMIIIWCDCIAVVHPKEKPPINVVGDVAGHIAIVVVCSDFLKTFFLLCVQVHLWTLMTHCVRY